MHLLPQAPAFRALLRRPKPCNGRFIAVVSSAATRGLPMLAAYCADKAGVVGLVRAPGLELRGTGVTANAVSPGSTRTPILEESAHRYSLASADEFAVQQPIERLLDPTEVAALIVWLASYAGSGVTGADLPIDGGTVPGKPLAPGLAPDARRERANGTTWSPKRWYDTTRASAVIERLACARGARAGQRDIARRTRARQATHRRGDRPSAAGLPGQVTSLGLV